MIELVALFVIVISVILCIVSAMYKCTVMGNPAIEAFHGGIICGLMDCAMTVTIMCVLEKAEPPSIINQTTSYLGSASLQSPVYVRAEITKPGRRIVGAYARAYQDNEVHLVAKCSSLFKLVERLRQ